MPTELDAAVESYLDCFPDSACATELDLLREVEKAARDWLTSHDDHWREMVMRHGMRLGNEPPTVAGCRAQLAKLDAHRKVQGENK